MSATSISFGLLILVFAILLLHWMHNKAETGESQSQRICPSCGSITSRTKERCLECGVASVSERRGHKADPPGSRPAA
jgi:uncharacterized paraquat-inducible protein A